MHIVYAYDVPLPNRFAATIQILKTGRALCEQGHRFILACGPAADGGAGALAELGIDPHPKLGLRPVYPAWPATRFLRPRLLRPWLLRRRTERLLRDDPPDVLISRGETGIALGRLAVPPATRFVLELHKLSYLERVEQAAHARIDPVEAARGRLFRDEVRAFHAARGLIYLSPGLREAAEAAFGAPRAPSVIVPSGTELPGRAPRARPDVDIVYVGKIERRKGLFLMLETMRHLPGRHLRLIGSGNDLDAARDWARRHGLAARIDFAGAVPHARVAHELARARVGVCLLPDDVDHVSSSFTSPLKLLEMMAAGLPVVATDVASVRNVCRNDVEALLAPPRAERIAAAIERLLSTPRLGERLGMAARQRARDFTWEARAGRIAAFCRDLAASA